MAFTHDFYLFKQNRVEGALNKQEEFSILILFCLQVPITTQWDKNGYYYATQICQYGLAHWSKAKMSNSLKEDVLWVEDGENSMNGAEWSGVSINR